jgi:endonuclease/exonuclease/phosphatase family metal-dependent hydrolase
MKSTNNIFRIVTWNCRRAAIASGVWDYLLEMNPDVALLQDVSSIPEKVRSHYAYQMHQATNKDGSPQRFSTALLVKGRICNKLILPSPEKWIAEELQRFSGNLVALEILPNNGPPMKAVSVYGPAWPIDRRRLSRIDATAVRLKLQSRDVWVMDLLWASLKYQRLDLDQPWIVAGDFNVSETFDWPKPRGNQEYLDRMRELGLVECLRQSKGVLTPTFRTPRDREVKHQIDHLFVSPVLAKRLITCDTGSSDRVFHFGLSDHLPIIADLRL